MSELKAASVVRCIKRFSCPEPDGRYLNLIEFSFKMFSLGSFVIRSISVPGNLEGFREENLPGRVGGAFCLFHELRRRAWLFKFSGGIFRDRVYYYSVQSCRKGRRFRLFSTRDNPRQPVLEFYKD